VGLGDIFIAIDSWRSFWSAQMAHSFAATDMNTTETQLLTNTARWSLVIVF